MLFQIHKVCAKFSSPTMHCKCRACTEKNGMAAILFCICGSPNTSFKQLFTSTQVAKLFDTHKVFSSWNIRLIVHFFCSIQFIFFQFLWWKPSDINSKFLAKVKIYSTLRFPETQYDHIVLQEMKTWFPENKKVLEAPNHLIFCGWLEDSIFCKLCSGHWLPQLCYLLVGLRNNIGNTVHEVC